MTKKKKKYVKIRNTVDVKAEKEKALERARKNRMRDKRKIIKDELVNLRKTVWDLNRRVILLEEKEQNSKR